MTQRKTPDPPPAYDPDRSVAYEIQMQPVRDAIITFLDSSARSVDLPIKADDFAQGRIEWNSTQVRGSYVYHLTRFTRSQVLDGVSRAAINAKADGGNYANGLTTGRSKLGTLTALRATYVTRASKVNPSRRASVLFMGLASHRKAVKTRAAQIEKAAAVEAGAAFMVRHGKKVLRTGKEPFDGTGDIKAFVSHDKAVKAWCRAVYGEDWWQTDKAARKIEGFKHVVPFEG